MRELVCDFSVSGLDNEIEEIVMYDEEIVTEERMTEVINNMVKGKMIKVGERCEGTVEIELGVFYVEYKWCSEVGDDWDTDSWEEETFEVNILKV